MLTLHGKELMGENLNRFGCLLGTWHPFKVGCELVYRRHLQLIIAPLIHSASPAQTIKSNMSFVNLVHLFTQLRLAYTVEVRSKLNEHLEQANARDKIYPKNYTALLIIRDFFEFFLPVVSS